MVDQQERNRKKALIIVQIVIYGFLLSMFLIAGPIVVLYFGAGGGPDPDPGLPSILVDKSNYPYVFPPVLFVVGGAETDCPGTGPRTCSYATYPTQRLASAPRRGCCTVSTSCIWKGSCRGLPAN